MSWECEITPIKTLKSQNEDVLGRVVRHLLCLSNHWSWCQHSDVDINMVSVLVLRQSSKQSPEDSLINNLNHVMQQSSAIKGYNPIPRNMQNDSCPVFSLVFYSPIPLLSFSLFLLLSCLLLPSPCTVQPLLDLLVLTQYKRVCEECTCYPNK